MWVLTPKPNTMGQTTFKVMSNKALGRVWWARRQNFPQ